VSQKARRSNAYGCCLHCCTVCYDSGYGHRRGPYTHTRWKRHQKVRGARCSVRASILNRNACKIAQAPVSLESRGAARWRLDVRRNFPTFLFFEKPTQGWKTPAAPKLAYSDSLGSYRISMTSPTSVALWCGAIRAWRSAGARTRSLQQRLFCCHGWAARFTEDWRENNLQTLL